MFTADELRSIIDILEMYCLECDFDIRRMEKEVSLDHFICPDHDLTDEYLEIDHHYKYLSHVESITNLVRSKLDDIDVPYFDEDLPF